MVGSKNILENEMIEKKSSAIGATLVSRENGMLRSVSHGSPLVASGRSYIPYGKKKEKKNVHTRMHRTRVCLSVPRALSLLPYPLRPVYLSRLSTLRFFPPFLFAFKKRV